MLEILLFSIGVMYTPGPVNIISLNNGMQKNLSAHLPFAGGVAVALCLWFLVGGYAGAAVLDGATLPVVGALGAGFTLYLAWKIMTQDFRVRGGKVAKLDGKDGFLLQLLNPKTFMVVIPVTTVQFPAAGIRGPGIALWSVGLALLGFGAPTLYAALGALLGNRRGAERYFRWANLALGLLLVAVAVDMGYRQVVLPLL